MTLRLFVTTCERKWSWPTLKYNEEFPEETWPELSNRTGDILISLADANTDVDSTEGINHTDVATEQSDALLVRIMGPDRTQSIPANGLFNTDTTTEPMT